MRIRTGQSSTDPGVKIIDTAGVPRGVLMEDGAITSRDYLIAISEGDIATHTLFSKLGYLATGTTTEQDMYPYGGVYPFKASAGNVDVLSSSDNDGKTSGAACTGVRVVTIYYLTAAYAEKTVDVTLNGTTAVSTTVGDIFRVNNFRVKSFGSGTTTYKAIGTIACTEVGAATTVLAQIGIGYTRGRGGIYTVPVDKSLYITSMAVGVTKGSTAGNSAMFTLRATYDEKLATLLTAGKFFMPFAEMNHMDGQTTREFHIPIKFIAGTDIKVSVLCGQSSTICTSSIRGWLE
jgi:hypothetical protein